MSTPYIGPERRKGERRDPYSSLSSTAMVRAGKDRRVTPDRRQDALAGVIVGLDADAMKVLAEVWRSVEAKCGKAGLRVRA